MTNGGYGPRGYRFYSHRPSAEECAAGAKRREAEKRVRNAGAIVFDLKREEDLPSEGKKAGVYSTSDYDIIKIGEVDDHILAKVMWKNHLMPEWANAAHWSST